MCRRIGVSFILLFLSIGFNFVDEHAHIVSAPRLGGVVHRIASLPIGVVRARTARQQQLQRPRPVAHGRVVNAAHVLLVAVIEIGLDSEQSLCTQR